MAVGIARGGEGRIVAPLLLILSALFLAMAAPAAAEIEPFEVREYAQGLDVPRGVAEENLALQQRGIGIVGELEAALGKDYAGVWFDNEAGEFVVPLLSGAGRAKVADHLVPMPEGGLRTVPARFSWDQLIATQARIDKTLSPLLEEDLVQTSLDPRTNSVVIHRAEGTDKADRAKIHDLVIGEQSGVEVRSEDVERFEAETAACGTYGKGVRVCDKPLRAGVFIEPSGPLGGWCTAGFKATGKVTGDRYMLTAGHCYENSEHWDTRDSQNVSRYVGYADQGTFPVHDYARIQVNGYGTWWEESPLSGWPSEVVYWGGNENTPIHSESWSYMGQAACHSGATTGSSCGTVTALHKTVNYPEGAVYNLTELSGGNFTSAGGDSGGPVWSVNTALGLHSGSGSGAGFYAEITEATDALGVTVGPRVGKEPDEIAPITIEDSNAPGPHIVAHPEGNVDVFYRRADGGLGHSWTEGGIWSTGTLVGTLPPSSVPHPVTQQNGTVDVFWRTAEGKLSHGWHDAFGWHTETLPGELASEPHPVAQPDGTIDVFYRTPSGNLGHNWYQSGGSWSSNVLPGEVASDPYPVANSDGSVDVFYRTPGESSGLLGHSWTNGGSWNNQILLGSVHVNADPHPVTQQNGTIDVFWRKPDNGLGHAWTSASGWHVNTLAGSLAGEPHPVAQPKGRIDVFYRNWEGHLGNNYYVPGGAWDGNLLTEGLTGEPFAIAQPDGTIDVFWKRTNDDIGHAWYVSGGGWSLGTLAGTMDPSAVPQAAAQPDGTIDVVYRTPGGNLGHNWYQSGGSWQNNAISTSVAGPWNGGKFNTASKWTPWSTAYSAQYADVNGDGKDDIVGRNSSGDVQVGLSTGTGFAVSSKWTTFSTAYSFDLADVNGDGKADVVGRNSGGDVQVGLSNGSSFGASTAWTTFSTAYSLHLADVTGDGKADIAGRNSVGTVQVGISTGAKFNAATNWVWWSPAFTFALGDTDVNGDGKADVVGRNSWNAEVEAGVSNGSTGFTAVHRGYWSNNYNLQVADVDGDGRADVLGRHVSSTDLRVGLIPGTSIGVPVTWASWPTTLSVTFADVNGDGRKDLVGRNSSGEVQVGLAGTA